ncbi:hypothetical protein, partial [Gardnerella vaginalis]
TYINPPAKHRASAQTITLSSVRMFRKKSGSCKQRLRNETTLRWRRSGDAKKSVHYGNQQTANLQNHLVRDLVQELSHKITMSFS